MSETPLEELVRLLDLEPGGPDEFVGAQSATAVETHHVFGGLVLAQALRAAAATTTPERAVHSLHAYFVRAGDPSQPIRFRVERTRDGRAISHRRVVAEQGRGVIADLTCGFAVPESGPTHETPPRQVSDPEDLRPSYEVLRDFPATFPHLLRPGPIDLRYVEPHPRVARERGERGERLQVWTRADGELPDDPVLHACVAVYATDLPLLDAPLRPHALSLQAGDLQPASLDHTVWFHAPVRADDWLLFDIDSAWMGSGRGTARGLVHRRDGVLALEVAQEGLYRPM